MKSKKNKADREYLLKNQDGSTILIVLMVMLLITIIGLASLNSTDAELKIAQNDRCFKQNLYRADAAALEAGAIMDGETNPKTNLKPASTSFDFLSDTLDFDPRAEQWDYLDTASQNARNSLVNSSDDKSGFTAVFKGLASGASLDMSNSTQLWEYDLYGRSEQCNGRVSLEVGYRRRY